MRAGGRLALLVLFCAIALASSPSRADLETDSGPSAALFALILGVNTSVDPGTPTLRYADDDAARYLEMFRSFGARTYVLTRADENTSRLHPQLVAEALLPVKADLDRAVESVARDVGQARQRHIRTRLYFVYAGHGNVKDGRGYVTLEDARLDAPTLDAEVVDRVGADETHFIVDACDSYFLALGRGPGGERHEAHGFSAPVGLRVRDSVGLLLSTSTARDSHEWSGFEAGVFSHEVRSALYGAADADGDGRISYREVASFVARANESIPNEEYRPNVYARPPKATPVLLDLRDKLRSRIEVPGEHAGHYWLEDSRGVRIADFHNDVTEPVHLARPAYTGRLYLRRVSDDVEFVIPPEPDVVRVAELTPSEPRERPRGAANDEFDLLFALPFGRRVAAHFTWEPMPTEPVDSTVSHRPGWRLYTGAALLVAAGATAAVGAWTLVSAHSLSMQVSSSLYEKAAQAQAASLDPRIRARNTAATCEFAAAGAAAVSGLVVWLWPAPSPRVAISLSGPGALLRLVGQF